MISEAAFASNPKDIVGVRKTPFSTLSGPILARMGVAMLEGALKYGRHNYRVVGVKASVYFDAFNRHVWAWYEGEDIDPESGEHHLIKAMTCLHVYLDAELRGIAVDDRPPCSLDFFIDLNEKVKLLREKYPNPEAPYTELEHGSNRKQPEDDAVQRDCYLRSPGLSSQDKSPSSRDVESWCNFESIQVCLHGVFI